MSRLPTGLVTLVLLAAASLAPAVDGPKPAAAPKRTPVPLTPLQVGQRYAKQLKDGDPVDAVRRDWDIDGMLDAAFTDSMKNVSAADRQSMKRLLLQFVERVHSNAELAAVLSQATLEGFRATEHDTDPKTATVHYYLVYKDQRVFNTILLRQSPDQRWHIIDAGAVGKMIVPIIRREYARQVDHMTPLEFMQDLVTRVHTP
jgi:hypothetical protein